MRKVCRKLTGTKGKGGKSKGAAIGQPIWVLEKKK